MNKKLSQRIPASRERILEEALAVGEELGWHKLTVRNIAGRLNYTPPVLYQHFKNKDDLKQNLLSLGFERLNETLQNAVSSSQKPEGQLLALAIARFRFALEHDALHSFMFSTGNPAWFKERVREGMKETQVLVLELLRSCSGRQDHCYDLLSHYVAIIKGFTFFSTELAYGNSCGFIFGPLGPEEAFTKAMRRFINSIKSE